MDRQRQDDRIDHRVIGLIFSGLIGVGGAILLAGVPELSNQYPNLAPTLLAWFPHSGQQRVPVGGVVLAVVARVVGQAAVIAAVKRLFGKKGDSDA